MAWLERHQWLAAATAVFALTAVLLLRPIADPSPSSQNIVR